MSLVRISISIAFFLMLVAVSKVSAQQEHLHAHPVLEAIDKAYQQGQLSTDESVLYKFYAVKSPSKLPANFQTRDKKPIKCGTPVFADYHRKRDQLSQTTINEIEAMSASSQASETYSSPSGNFLIHYETDDVAPADTNSNNVPDYVEYVAAAADSSLSHEVGSLGFTNPILQSDPYDVTIDSLVDGLYGFTRPLGNTTDIFIDNDFLNGFPPNDHPDGNQIGAINVTIAHELKHAIQYAATEWNGESDQWAEMDATLMEEVVYDNVNDYYNYLESSVSIFNNPHNSFFPGSYYHVSWALFFEQKFGSNFWVNVWRNIKQDPYNITFIEAITQELGDNQDFKQNFLESHLWHYASGPENSAPNYGFEERTNYPDPAVTETILGIQGSLQEKRNIKALAANYFKIENNGVSEDQVIITLNTQTALIDTSSNISKIPLNYSVGAIAYFKDGSIGTLIDQSSSASGKFDFKTPWDWSNINKIGLVVLNQNEDSRYQLNTNIATGSYKQDLITLEQNYPNPFNGTTTIEFTLQQDSNVQLKLYDVTGRLVRTIIDGQQRTAGTYSPTLSSDRLASGIYFYRLITDKRSKVKKLTLIK